MENNKKTVIHWFRKGLRVHDNPSLTAALDLVEKNENYIFRAIYIFDPEIENYVKIGANRKRFIQQSLVQLDENLRKILNTRLCVVRGTTKNQFQKLFKEWNVVALFYEREVEPYIKRSDALVKIQAEQFNVKIEEFVSHTLYDSQKVLELNDNRPPKSFQSFQKLVGKMKIPQPILVKKGQYVLNANDSEAINATGYDIPTFEELQINESELGPVLYPGGEAEALARMKKHLTNTTWIRDFSKPDTATNSLEPSTTVLSPYLALGCLSCRLFYHEIQKVLKKFKKHTEPPVSLVGQLLWREFFYVAAESEENFNKIAGNSLSRLIPWYDNDDLLSTWANGRTGYPYVDALMRQLRQEGWIHHLGRHVVACFLTRGDLYLSWEAGMKVFEELLLDADWALNAGNWIWVSCSGFYYQYFRVYNPALYGKKTDPEAHFIRKYCPELKHLPRYLIYQPWRATPEEQKEYKCILGTDYPQRIVVHEAVQSRNKFNMSAAYDEHKARMAAQEGEPSETNNRPRLEEVPVPLVIKEEVPVPFIVKEEVPVPFIKVEKIKVEHNINIQNVKTEVEDMDYEC